MEKVVITVLGKDRTGIIASVCNILADSAINILDISQTIVDEYFNMVMVVDIAKAEKSFEAVAEALNHYGDSCGLKIKMQHTKIFDAMHRI